MKFARIGPVGHEVPAALVDEVYFDLRPLTGDIDGTFLSDAPVERTRAALAAGDLPLLPSDAGTRIGAPIARPGAIICVGMNYVAHAAESGSAPPELPVIFLKTPNTIGGPNDDVVIPRTSEKTDWEVELGIVIGRTASYLAGPESSAAHIAGYTAVNDVSERAFQLEVSGGQWSKGKCSPGFTPTGPWLVTSDEVSAQEVSLRSRVNGELRQDSTAADMIFSVDYIVWHLSQYLVLDPGDLILTGTPEGVALSGRFPYLNAGDVVDIEIEGLGRQRQTFVSWSAS